MKDKRKEEKSRAYVDMKRRERKRQQKKEYKKRKKMKVNKK